MIDSVAQIGESIKFLHEDLLEKWELRLFIRCRTKRYHLYDDNRTIKTYDGIVDDKNLLRRVQAILQKLLTQRKGSNKSLQLADDDKAIISTLASRLSGEISATDRALQVQELMSVIQQEISKKIQSDAGKLSAILTALSDVKFKEYLLLKIKDLGQVVRCLAETNPDNSGDLEQLKNHIENETLFQRIREYRNICDHKLVHQSKAEDSRYLACLLQDIVHYNLQEIPLVGVRQAMSCSVSSVNTTIFQMPNRLVKGEGAEPQGGALTQGSEEAMGLQKTSSPIV